MFELKVNRSTLKKWLDKTLDGNTNHALDLETIAKCYLYLNNKAECEAYFNKAIINIEEIAESFKKNKDMQFYAKRKLNYANYHRIIGKQDEMKQALEEIVPIYESLYTGRIKEKPDSYSMFYFEWCSVHFHLGNYEEAYNIGKFIRYSAPVAPRGYAKGLLDNNKTLIEKTLEEVIKYIKDERTQPFYNPLNIEDPWEWYEIGRQLLGLPSVLDMFKEDSK